MKNLYVRGERKNEYSAPTIERLDVSPEQGFAASTGVEAPDWNEGIDDWWSAE